MIYSRSYLESIKRSFAQVQEAMQTLADALVAGTTLTLSEGKFLGSFLGIAETNNRESLNALYKQLPDYHFWQIYIRYAKDVNGEGGISTPFGYVSSDQKAIDVNFLDSVYQEWKPMVYKLRHKYTELQFLTSESRKDMKATLEFNRQLRAGSRRMKIIEKALILHSKFVFSKIEEYYQEYDVRKDVMEFCGKEVVVDSYTYAHVGIRHMAEWTKFGRTDKTCHGPEIDIDNLPRVITGFLNDYSRNVDCANFDQRRIYFKYKGRNNVIKFEQLSSLYRVGKYYIIYGFSHFTRLNCGKMRK